MRIAIICGSLEPGKDGVGDYTRRLAGEVIRQGHNVIAIAINDRHLKTTAEQIQDADQSQLPVLRIAASVTDINRFGVLKDHLNNFKPDWVSLQFVPYSFHIKGIPLKLFKQLAALNIETKWHVLFHEIWLDKAERISQHVVIFLQKAAIYLGVKKLNPQVVNTTIPYNQQRLQGLGISSSVLGLFGNISKSSGTSPIPSCIVNGAQNILYFGGAPRNEYLKQVITGLEQFCRNSKQLVNIVLVSGHSTAKDIFVQNLTGKLAKFGTQVKDMGFVETPVLSTLLSNCSAGIIRSEPYFVGKSGSAVAMLEHGLPIWLPKWTGKAKIDYNFRKHLIHASLSEAAVQTHESYESLLPSVTQKFIHQLSSN